MGRYLQIVAAIMAACIGSLPLCCAPQFSAFAGSESTPIITAVPVASAPALHPTQRARPSWSVESSRFRELPGCIVEDIATVAASRSWHQVENPTPQRPTQPQLRHLRDRSPPASSPRA